MSSPPSAAVLAARLERARARWRWRGDERPPFAAPAGPGRESVWDYPRPPRWVDDPRLVQVYRGGESIASSRRARRVLETASPPTFYLPPEDVRRELLTAAPGSSLCEWKGWARYWALAGASPPTGEVVAWSYPEPFPGFGTIAGWIAFYPGRVECRVDGEPVRPQPGGYYGGWVTAELAGPFKGEPGSEDW